MDPALAKSFADAVAEAKAFANRSLDEHFEELRRAIALSDAFARANPRVAQLRRTQDPVPAQYQAHLISLWQSRP